MLLRNKLRERIPQHILYSLHDLRKVLLMFNLN
jgi:hypothetical protein